MTPEEMKFWLDMFHSPVAIALASGGVGSFLTLIVTVLTLCHKTKESKEEWKRQEERRKEERFFTLKNKAYRDFNKLFLIDRKTGQPLFATKWIGVSSALISYVSKPFRREIMLLIGIASALKKAEENGEKAEIPELERKFGEQIDAIHEKIHEDIISHHESVFNSQKS